MNVRKYSKVLVPGVLMVVGYLVKLVGSDFEMSTDDAAIIASGIGILGAIFFAPRNRG